VARIPVAAIYLALLFALNVYRAATQSFVIDEGYSYQLYVGHQPFSLFRYYDANLHVLHTLLCWVSVRLFGLSELTFRLPSLLGCAVYFGGVLRLSGLLFPDGWRRLVVVIVLTANPLIQDHMSVGRGYGLALAFLVWAFCEAISATPRLPWLAVLLALSIASNFTFLFPAVALLAMVAGVLVWQRGVGMATVVQELLGPWLVVTFLILVMPFSRLEPGAFYFGAADLMGSLRSLAPPAVGMALLAVACFVAFRRAAADAFALLAGGTLVLTIGGVVAAHVLFRVPYPQARTGIYLLFLLPLCLLPLARWQGGAMVLLALSVAMAQGIRIDRYAEWTFDANSRDIAAAIVARHGSSTAPVRVACRLPLCRALQLYTVMWKLGWADVQEVTSWAPGFDYYLLSGEVEREAASLGLHVIYYGPVSGVALAAAGDTP
jgi:hypothetical protein